MSCTVATPAFSLRVYSYHAAILATKRLLLLSCGCLSHADMQLRTHLHYLNVAILATIQLQVSPCHHVAILAAVRPYSYSCHNVAIFAAMQPMWLFLLPCNYSCHNVAILAAMQPLTVAM